MFPLLLIAVGVLVLLFGKRLAVLGAAVGALLGLVLLNLFPGERELWFNFAVVLGLGLLGFFAAGFARGIVDIVILVLATLAGAELVLAILNLFNIDWGIVNWLLALVGGLAGFMLIRSTRDNKNDWGMIILASLIGALLVTRGLVSLIPALQDTLFKTLLLAALFIFGMAFEGGLLSGRGKSEPAPAEPTVVKPAPKPAAEVPAAAPPPPPAASTPAPEDKPKPPPAA